MEGMTREVTGGVPAAPAPAAVDARDVRRSFGDREILKGLDLRIAAGEFAALLGASGSGKSTLLRALAGLDPETTGQIDVPERRSIVFQEHRLLPWKRVAANVGLGLDGERLDERVKALLAEVGLAQRADAWPRTLSGGEAQRAALARSLVREPDLLLLDVPFGALDAFTKVRMHRLVVQLHERYRPAVLLVTHDLDEALMLADRVLVLVDGHITASFPVEVDHPRHRDAPAVVHLRHQVLDALGMADFV